MLSAQAARGDWRYRGQDQVLSGRRWEFRLFQGGGAAGPSFCEFCAHPFTALDPDANDLDALDRGWCSTLGERWVCRDCMNDFGRLISAELLD